MLGESKGRFTKDSSKRIGKA